MSMIYQVLWQSEAEADLKEIAFYYHQVGGLELAERNIDRILASIDGLQSMPERCQVSDFSGNIRKLSVYKMPYVVFFKIIDDKVYLLNIFNTRRSQKILEDKYQNF